MEKIKGELNYMSNIKEMTPEQFRKMQRIELELLIEFDRVCKAHDIKYVLWGGTLLGAVRHKGFIPWDGDIDVAMTREEYNKFVNVSQSLDKSVCWFQDHDTDSLYPWGYGKIRKTGTKYVREGQEKLKCENGVFMDIFAEDDIPRMIVGQMFQDFYCFIARKIQYAEIGKYGNKHRLLYSMLSKIPRNVSFSMLNCYIKKSNNLNKNKVRVLTYTSIGKLYYKHKLTEKYGMPKEWFLDTKFGEFEGMKFPIPKKVEECLTHIFGEDYMTPPPLNKRTLHTAASYYEF